MQDNKKPKNYPAHTSGGLWSQQKTSSGQPDMKGSIEITQHQMQQLVQMGKTGQEPTLQIAAWSKQSQSGSNWLSIDADVYIKDAGMTPAAPDMSAPAPAYAPPAAQPAQPAPPAPPAQPAPAMAPPPLPDFSNDGNF
tara:strand:- start:8628 stop:9041 length:414 start_codon:yes stop_codon:yes gene_type:complete